MSRLLNPLVRNSFLPLRDAILCTECEFISANAADTCSVCGSTSLLQLHDLIKSQAAADSPGTPGSLRAGLLCPSPMPQTGMASPQVQSGMDL
jgi:hypothetical protein